MPKNYQSKNYRRISLQKQIQALLRFHLLQQLLGASPRQSESIGRFYSGESDVDETEIFLEVPGGIPKLIFMTTKNNEKMLRRRSPLKSKQRAWHFLELYQSRAFWSTAFRKRCGYIWQAYVLWFQSSLFLLF